MKRRITFDGPVLPGSVSVARSRCGKIACVCKGKPRRLHGAYYRWTGFIGGTRTTKTISRETALECKRRIQNFRKLQREIKRLVRKSLRDAPWAPAANESKKRGNR
ncbi:MAG: DUF6788 family protein [Terriglobia bacterium]